MTDMIKIEVRRYRPEQDQQPFLQLFDVPYSPEMSVLDGLKYIKDHLDGSLSFRWSCQMAICGSCGYMVDNIPKLGCKTFLRDYFPNKVTIAPLANFPIERDLVSDISDFVAKLEEIKPYLIRGSEGELVDGEYIQTPAQLKRFKQYSMCINCGLCYAACPQYGMNNEFLGPAALALMHRYNQDNRDQGKAERYPMLNSEQGVWSCTFVGYCSDVCPKSVDPAAAINQGKTLSATDYVISKILPAKQYKQMKEQTHD